MTSSAKLPQISVILPTYNEAGHIAALIEEIHEVVDQPHEIIVVDDNSPDGTSQIIESLIGSATISDLRLETRYKDRGLTKSINRGIELSQGKVIVWMDADFSMSPRVIPQLLLQIEAGYDLCIGSRFLSKQGQKRNWEGESWVVIKLSTFLNFGLRRILFKDFSDYTSGFIAIRRTVFNHIKLSGDYGEYFIDLLCRAKLLKYRIVEIPHQYEPRRSGESKTAPNVGILFMRGGGYLVTVIRMLYLRISSLMGSRFRTL